MDRPVRILVFDSGLGGLTVTQALRDLEPDAGIVYGADNAGFPYGAWSEEALARRIVSTLGKMIARTSPDVAVVACNTASTIALPLLRHSFDLPIVGTVPAIKPAAGLTRSGQFSVLATPGTIARDYTRALMDTYAFHCKVKLHGPALLAELAEDKLMGRAVDMDVLRTQISPAFVEEENGRTDVVVLGCTHYPLLIEEIKAVAPWPVDYIDPARAIARQALKLADRGKVDGGQCWEFANHAFLSGPWRAYEPALTDAGFTHAGPL